MTEPFRPEFPALSQLLCFPDADLVEALPQIAELLGGADAEPAMACAELMRFLQETRLLSVQELYTTAFDLEPSTSLNLTFHRWGDGKERGKALSDLVRLYREEGYGMAPGELPDFLPLVLEFLSVCPEAAFRNLSAAYGESMENLGKRLRERGNPYGAAVHAASILLKKKEPTHL
jgi:nitrate reductase delta subunit